MKELTEHPEWAALKMRGEYLRGRCADEVEEYMHLVNCIGPNLESMYMAEIGQYEHRVYQLKIEIARWRRRFTLRQQALNRGAAPDPVAIESALDEEFKAYMAEIKAHQEALKAAAEHLSCPRLSDEETSAIRMNYLKAVKRLHPDLNPDLPQSAAELWNRIQKAYGDKDWKELGFLASMVDEVAGGKREFACGCDSMEDARREIGRLEARLAELCERRAELMKRQPYCWKDLFEHADEVELRRATLKEQIGELQEAVEEYEELWKRKEVA